MFTIVFSYRHSDRKEPALHSKEQQGFNVVRSYGIGKGDCFHDISLI